MYQHLRIAIEQAEERRLHEQQQRNFRRLHRNTIEICPTTVVDDSVTIYDNKMEVESNNNIEMIHQLPANPDETSDVNDDFDLFSYEENSTDLQFELNSDCLMSMENDDEAEPLLLDDLFHPNNNQTSHYLHLYTTIKTHEFCRQLIEVFRDANIINTHCTRILNSSVEIVNSVRLEELFSNFRIMISFTIRIFEF